MASTRLPIPTRPSRWRLCRDCAHALTRSGSIAHTTVRYHQSLTPTSRDFTSEAPIPLRKQLKDEAKRKKALKRSSGSNQPDNKSSRWELTVGIEVHAELNTARKLFSRAATSSNARPNSHVSVFDLAFPGAQPQFQQETLIPAVRAALALGCQVQRRSRWDRKHYFYQDQPNGYQITQYYEPFAKHGHLTLYSHDGIAAEDGPTVTIGIKQIQLEQDTAKTIAQPPSTHLLDFNRVSHPLIEIITLPQIHHPATAAAVVRKIQACLRSVDAVTAGMELGGLRADVNVSVRPREDGAAQGSDNEYAGVTGLGTRTEIKNLSTFKSIEDAVIAERDRQIEVLEAGGVIEGETRGWSLGSTETKKLRGKEGEVDYRYMPDPDLGPLVIGPDLIEALKESLPVLPDSAVAALVSEGVSTKDAKTMAVLDDGDRIEYFWETVRALKELLGDTDHNRKKIGKTVANSIVHELPPYLQPPISFQTMPITPTQLTSILHLLLTEQITTLTSRHLLGLVFAGDRRSITDILDAENLRMTCMSDAEYAVLAQDVVKANPNMVEAVAKEVRKGKGGEKGKVMWFVGQMIKIAGNKQIEADRAAQAVRKALEV